MSVHGVVVSASDSGYYDYNINMVDGFSEFVITALTMRRTISSVVNS
jgi:hypothetical protein